MQRKYDPWVAPMDPVCNRPRPMWARGEDEISPRFI